MLKLGDKNIKNLKLGDKGIFKAMYNGKTVYRNHPVFLDYVEFDGNSWIDTLFKPHPRTTRTVLDCMLLDNTSSGGQGIFGARPTTLGSINSVNLWFNTSDAQKCFRFDCTGNAQIRSNVIDITQRLHIDCLDKNATVNGVTYSSNINKSNTTYIEYAMYLGNFNNAGNPYTKGCKMYVYGFTIYDNGVLFQDLRPALDPCNVVCLYDLVSGKYFYNQGTGTLKAGGRFVESIIFDGNSWIDTGKYANQNTEINITFKHNTLERAIYGVRDENNNCTGYASVNGAWRFGSNMAHYRTEANTIYNVVQNRQGIDINGLYTAYTDTTSEFTSSYTILLGKQNNTTFSPFKGEINVFRIKESGVDIQDLRPLVDEDGVACFVDLVTGERFYNQGTGKLKYKDFERLPYLDFDGASYIDTGVKGRSGISVNYDVYIPKTNIDTGLVFPTGSRNEGDARFYLGVVIYGYGKCWGLSIGYDSYDQNQKPTGDKYYSIIANTSSTGGELIVDGKSIVTTTATVTTDYNIYVGGANNYGTPQLTGSNGLRFKHYTMYEDDKLKRQYIPIRRSDNVICFYDFAEGKYYEFVGG